MVAESAGKELIDSPGSGRIAAAAASWPRPGTLAPCGFRRRREDGCDHAAMLGYLQNVAVLDPDQVLAGVVAQLPDSDSHVLMLSHVLSQTHLTAPSGASSASRVQWNTCAHTTPRCG